MERCEANYTALLSSGSARQLRQADGRHIVASGVTRLMVDGVAAYEIHTEIVTSQQFGEYADKHGVVGKRSLRLRIVHKATGDQAIISPFGVSPKSIATKDASLLPNFYHFAFKPAGKPQTVSTFVSTVRQQHDFASNEGQAEWNSFVSPFLTHYWSGMVKDYQLTRSSRRALTVADDVAAVADDAIQYGEGKVDSWASSEGGTLGAEAGEDIGEKVGGYVGGAIGGAVGGPAGAVVGHELGSWAGGEAGSYLGKKAGSDLANDAASGLTSDVGQHLTSDVNSWASSEDSSGGFMGSSGGFSYMG